jgi:hypothetical protein
MKKLSLITIYGSASTYAVEAPLDVPESSLGVLFRSTTVPVRAHWGFCLHSAQMFETSIQRLRGLESVVYVCVLCVLCVVGSFSAVRGPRRRYTTANKSQA